MNQEGEQRGPRSGAQDDWWSQLYDPASPDTGRTRAGDTIDDRFASVTRTVGPGAASRKPPEERREESGPEREPGTTGPGQGERRDPEQDPGPRAGPVPPEPQPEPGREPESGRDEPGGEPAPPMPREQHPPTPAFTPTPTPTPTHESEPAPEPAPGPELGPGTLPAADPAALAELVPDTVLDGAHYGTLTLRAASVRGEAARRNGGLRQEALLTARFGEGDSALLLIAVAAGEAPAPGAHRAAREICHSIGGAVGRSRSRLAEDIAAGRRGALKSGLQRLTDRSYGKLRAQAAALGLQPEEYTADLRCLLLPADPRCATRVFFGAGSGGLFRLREGAWQDIEPSMHDPEQTGGPVLGYGAEPPDPRVYPAEPRPTMDLGIATPDPPGLPTFPTPANGPLPDGPFPVGAPAEPPSAAHQRAFRFRASVARPGDTLLLCSAGLAEPMREESVLADRLAGRWAGRAEPPGLAEFLTDVQLRVKGYGGDRTAVAVWEDSEEWEDGDEWHVWDD